MALTERLMENVSVEQECTFLEINVWPVGQAARLAPT
jgi:hypothetical protein